MKYLYQKIIEKNLTKKGLKLKISNYPFGKDTKSPDYYYTQNVYSDRGKGITGKMKKRKKKKNARIYKIKKTT